MSLGRHPSIRREPTSLSSVSVWLDHWLNKKIKTNKEKSKINSYLISNIPMNTSTKDHKE